MKKKKDEYFEGQTSGRPKLTLAEQLIEHVMKTDLMDDKELRDEIYTIFTAVGAFVYQTHLIRVVIY